MSSKNTIRHIKKNKVKSNGSKLYQLKSSNTVTVDKNIIDLDTSSSSIDSTNNNSLNISISENKKFLKHSLTPLINIKKPVLNEKGVLVLSRLPKSLKLLPNSAITSLLAHKQTSGFIMTDNELDRFQWELESMMSSILELKNTAKDNFQSLSSIKCADYQQYGITKSYKLSVIKSKPTEEILPVNEYNEIKDEIDSSSELTESSFELTKKISKPNELFWTFVKTYLASVSKDDLNWLKSLVLSYNTSLAEIPPLNEHYTKVWIKEKSTQNNQSSDTNLDTSFQEISPDVIELLNKVNHAAHDDSVFPSVFQRVVSALKEHLNTFQKDNTKENIEKECIENESLDMSNFCKKFYKENNMKNQLLNLGLAGHYSKPVFLPTSEPETDFDEILEELMKCDIALNKLREGNKYALTELFKKCSLDYQKQKIKNKIDKVNCKILKFKKRSNKNLKHKKHSQIAEENNRLRRLLDKRNKYLSELSEFMNSYISDSSTPNDSSSGEESIYP